MYKKAYSMPTYFVEMEETALSSMGGNLCQHAKSQNRNCFEGIDKGWSVKGLLSCRKYAVSWLHVSYMGMFTE